MESIESIEYDPLKEKIGKLVSRNVLLRRLFYTALGMLFLRQWHVRAELKRIARREIIRDILDAGSGFGQYTYLMSKLFRGARILAVDVKEEQVNDCRWFTSQVHQPDTTFEVADLTVFAKPNSFDLALSVDVMEHIEDDLAVFRNIYASLRPNGLFVVATPCANEDLPPAPPGQIHSVIGEHVRQGYTRREFLEKMSQSGFVVEKLKETYGTIWGKLAWMILQRIPMLLLSRSKLFFVVVIPWITLLYLPAALCMWLDVRAKQAKPVGGWLMIARKR